MTPDTIFSESDGYEISIDVKEIHDPREPGIYSALEYLRSLTKANIMAPDIIFSGEDMYQISSHFNQIHGLRDLEILVHQNI